MHIKRGTEVELPFDLPITKLPKDEYLKYSVFFSQQPMLVPVDSEQGRKILSEKQAAVKAERKKRAWSLEKWCLIIGVILAALTFVWGVFVWLKPTQ